MKKFFLFNYLFLQLAAAMPQDKVGEKMEWYGKSKVPASLFIHFDKNVYTNNETVYFTAYILGSRLPEINKHRILSVALIRDADSSLVFQDKFLLENALGFGSFSLPDSLITGDYHLVSFTDQLRNGKPELKFLQEITIKSSLEPAFKAGISFLDDPKEGALKKVIISVMSAENKFLPKPATILYRYGKIIKSVKTDASGQVLLNLPVGGGLADPNLYVKLKYGNDSSFLTTPVPQPKIKPNVKFYPEGGSLVNGLPATVGWELKDQQNRGIAADAFLYKNGEIADTISSDAAGLGTFRLVPEKGMVYTVKLHHSGISDSTYFLPAASERGLSIEVSRALARDTLSLILRKSEPGKLFIRLHNFTKSYLQTEFEMLSRIKTVKIPLSGIPKGIMALTLSDSLGRPLAERIFFAHFDLDKKLSISFDKQSYGLREKVTIKVSLTDTSSTALASIACVQSNRLDHNKMTDIESFTYLTRELNTLQQSVNGRSIEDLPHLEKVLLIKGWRRYSSEDFNKVSAADTVYHADSLKITGVITKSRKEITKPLMFSLFGARQLQLTETNTKGAFQLSNESLIADAGRKIYLFVNEKNKLPYEIRVNDNYADVNDQIAKAGMPLPVVYTSGLNNNQELVLKSNERAIKIKEVEIKSRQDLSVYSIRNACGEYICMYNILNCRNHVSHPSNKLPVVGHEYLTNGTLKPYRGCNTPDPTFFPVKAIHLPKEFYVSDYQDTREPAFFSTLYWNYSALLKKGKETEITFYTGDITGRFRIVVQGITEKDVIFGQSYFEVKN